MQSLQIITSQSYFHIPNVDDFILSIFLLSFISYVVDLYYCLLMNLNITLVYIAL